MERRFLLGYPPMDAVHEEFVGLVGAMKTVSDADLPALLDRFAVPAKDHFQAEDAWMEQTDFPPASVTSASMLRS